MSVADSSYPHLMVWAIGEARRRRFAGAALSKTPDEAGEESALTDELVKAPSGADRT